MTKVRAQVPRDVAAVGNDAGVINTKASDVLADAIRRMKTVSPLAMVTVIVPSNGAARDAMKHLARGEGLANVRMLTLRQAVALLAAPALAPRLPLDYPLLEASVQRVLSEQPGLFEDVATEPITSQALAGASLVLAGYSDINAEATTPIVEDTLRVHLLATKAHNSSYYLPHEAYAAALDRLDELGKIIVFQPCESDPAALKILHAMQRRGLTVDGEVAATGTMVVHTSDADDEVRA